MKKKNIKVLVCGGRYYKDKKRVYDILDKIHSAYTISRIIHGDSSGADALANKYAKEKDFTREIYPAKWKEQGRGAGPIRNAKMLAESGPDLVVTFPGGDGTEGMRKLAKKAQVKIHEVKDV